MTLDACIKTYITRELLSLTGFNNSGYGCSLDNKYSKLLNFNYIGTVTEGDFMYIPTIAFKRAPFFKGAIKNGENFYCQIWKNLAENRVKKSGVAIIKKFNVSSQLLTKVTVEGDERVYYGVRGAIFDSELHPLFMLILKINKNDLRRYNTPIKHTLIVGISNLIFDNEKYYVEKMLIKKFIPIANKAKVYINYNRYIPELKSNWYLSKDSNIDILITNLNKYMKYPQVPSTATNLKTLEKRAILTNLECGNIFNAKEQCL